MTEPNPDMFVWVDTENFGLTPNTDPIIELGIRITDIDLNTIAYKSWTIWDQMCENRLTKMHQDVAGGNKDALYVFNMHSDNLLFAECRRNGMMPGFVTSEAIKFLEQQEATYQPMCGSSIQFDRSLLKVWLPNLEANFHYRNIDVSTVKELCRRMNPRVFEHAPIGDSNHRVINCLDCTIKEFRYYQEEFLLW